MRVAAAVFAWFLTSLPLGAQAAPLLVVTVVDDAGQPMPDVKVSVLPLDQPEISKRTDAEGKATFEIPPGDYRVTAFAERYRRATSLITVAPNEPTPLKMVLRKGPVSDPPPPPMPVPQPVEQPVWATTDIEQKKDFARVRIYYATDRKYTGASKPESAYGSQRGELTRGVADVSIPRDHRIGRIESASILRLEFRENPAKHVVLLNVLPQAKNAFYAKLRDSVARSKSHQAFIFIHGFNNSFADAAKRTAQIKYDLAFDGPAILFSWPSLASAKPTAYMADENNSEWSIPHLRDFLLEVAQESGAQAINVIGHSMGNRVLARAFQQLPPTPGPRFNQVLLTAPDIDVDVFRELAATIRAASRHVTLYVSNHDEALDLSRQLHGGIPRAGDSSQSVVIADGIDTVDVSAVDTSFLGHSYVADNRTVLSDVYCLIRGAAQAATRCRLVSRRGYWEFAAQLDDVVSLVDYVCSAPGCRLSDRP